MLLDNLTKEIKMHYLETDVTGEHIRIEWNGSSNYNLQVPIGGEWVDYHCFTCYKWDNEQDAMGYALEVLIEENGE